MRATRQLGFIDLHVHGQTHEGFEYMVRDGVTTGLELEVGTGDVAGTYTLVLTKTEALFEREAAARRTQRADLAWLTGRSR